MTGKTALYVRVSTDEQELDAQRELVSEYATGTLDVDVENEPDGDAGPFDAAEVS